VPVSEIEDRRPGRFRYGVVKENRQALRVRRPFSGLGVARVSDRLTSPRHDLHIAIADVMGALGKSCERELATIGRPDAIHRIVNVVPDMAAGVAQVHTPQLTPVRAHNKQRLLAFAAPAERLFLDGRPKRDLRPRRRLLHPINRDIPRQRRTRGEASTKRNSEKANEERETLHVTTNSSRFRLDRGSRRRRQR
jgi:hypothetical protein